MYDLTIAVKPVIWLVISNNACDLDSISLLVIWLVIKPVIWLDCRHSLHFLL